VLPLVLIAALVARIAWLDLPHGTLIFDESYYVNAARVLLGWTVPTGANYAGSPVGLDPNTEHPPLGKLLIATSMLAFGDNGLGWRIPSVVAGMVALGAVYGIVRAGGESAWLAILAVVLVAFDNLTLVHGRIGTLDMLALAPILVGAWLALRERWGLAGLAMAVGLLVKLTAIWGVVAVLLYVMLRAGGRWWRERRVPRSELLGPAMFGVTVLAVWFVGLGVLDARFTTFSSPIEHLRRMIDYGATLQAPAAQPGFCPGTDSRPWDWLFNACQIPYLRVDVTVRSAGQVVSSVPSIDIRGALNPLLVGAIPLATLWLLWHARATGSRVAIWAVAWGAANYLPYVALALTTRRIMYLYYMLPVVPAIAVAIALLLLRSGMPVIVRWGFVAAYALGFAAYFPFRQLP